MARGTVGAHGKIAVVSGDSHVARLIGQVAQDFAWLDSPGWGRKSRLRDTLQVLLLIRVLAP